MKGNMRPILGLYWLKLITIKHSFDTLLALSAVMAVMSAQTTQLSNRFFVSETDSGVQWNRFWILKMLFFLQNVLFFWIEYTVSLILNKHYFPRF